MRAERSPSNAAVKLLDVRAMADPADVRAGLGVGPVDERVEVGAGFEASKSSIGGLPGTRRAMISAVSRQRVYGLVAIRWGTKPRGASADDLVVALDAFRRKRSEGIVGPAGVAALAGPSVSCDVEEHGGEESGIGSRGSGKALAVSPEDVVVDGELLLRGGDVAFES